MIPNVWGLQADKRAYNQEKHKEFSIQLFTHLCKLMYSLTDRRFSKSQNQGKVLGWYVSKNQLSKWFEKWGSREETLLFI